MILEVFSNLNDSVILFQFSHSALLLRCLYFWGELAVQGTETPRGGGWQRTPAP